MYMSDCNQIYILHYIIYVLVEMKVYVLWIMYGMLKKENALVSIRDIYKNNIDFEIIAHAF